MRQNTYMPSIVPSIITRAQEAISRRPRYLLLALILLTLFLYWPVTQHAFINLDDSIYVTENKRVQAGLSWENVLWALTTWETGNWHPLTWLSHLADCHIYGIQPQGHHVTNLILHLLNVYILFGLLKHMTGRLWATALVTGLFALHPLHVEPVAWISERKELLCTFFWITTIRCYVDYVQTRKKWYYALALFCFILGLMAKPMIVTLPCVLLLLDYWPLNRFSNFKKTSPVVSLIREKIPFFLITALACAATFMAQQHEGAVSSLTTFSWDIRLGNGVLSYMRYLRKTAWPQDLAVYYPHPGGSISSWEIFASAVALVSISAGAVATIKRHPYFFVGWFWFIGTLVPVIGLVQVGSQAMADRYTYIPLLGIFIALAWGLQERCAKRPALKLPLLASMTLFLGACAIITSQQVGYWKNSLTLFEHTVAVTTHNAFAHNNLGRAWAEINQPGKAAVHYKKAIHISPHYAEPYNNLGSILAHGGNTREAMAYYNQAILMKPDYVDARYNLANALAREMKFEDAVFHYRETLKREQGDNELHNNIGIALMHLGKFQAAIAHFRRALAIDPKDSLARHNLELALGSGNRES